MKTTRTGNRRRMLPAMVAALALAASLVQGLAQAEDIVVPFTPLETLYAEDFEGGNGGFTTGGSASWQYGEAISPPTPAAGQGPNMWGTTLAGSYANNECGYIQSPPIDLSAIPIGVELPEGIQVARLIFKHWMHVEARYDGGILMASSNGTDFAPITPVGGYTHTPLSAAQACLGIGATDTFYSTASSPAPAADAWKVASFDVTKFLGGALHLRWVFASDSSVVYRGWYVDDVAVQLGVGVYLSVDPTAPPVPVNPEVPFTPVTAVYAEDFDATDGGWSATGAAWEWGEPASPPTTLPGSLKVWGTRLLGDYLPNECSFLTSPPIELPGAGAPGVQPGANAAELSFQLWRYLENGYDGAMVQASSDDGASWKTLTPAGGYDRTLFTSSSAHACLGTTGANPMWSGPSTAPAADAWARKTVDLTSLLGSTIKLRFAFASDVDTERRGVYVDDVLIQLGIGAKPGASPQCAPAPGWTSSGANNSWCYGPATTGPISAKPVYATNLAGNYNASECSAIVSPPVPAAAVPGLGTLTLTFEHFMQTASTDDGGIVQVSGDDGATWKTVTPVGGYPSVLGTSARTCVAPSLTTQRGFASVATAGTYQLREAKLDGITGDTIRVRFIFGSGPSSESLGWYIRTVGLNRGAGSVPLLG